MKNMDYVQAAPILLDRLAHGGVFLSTPGNTMTIGWGSAGVLWGKPTLTVLVRPQRDTYHRLLDAGEFTVSVPVHNDLKDQLIMAGTLSGADTDKFSGRGLTALPAQKVSAPVVAECGLHFECVIRSMQPLTGGNMDPAYLSRYYPGGDFHALFFGEIIACYTTDD